MRNLVQVLKKKLASPLPGEATHNELSPLNKKERLLALKEQENPKLSAVLILLFKRSKNIHFALMQRPEYNGVHSKQISLPGGKKEPQDNNLQETALRETFEEFGIKQKDINIIGELTNVYVPVSQYLITPFIGFSEKEIIFSPDPKEVESIIEISITELLDDKNLYHGKIQVSKGIKYDVPHFKFKNDIVWGATSMILNELKKLLR